MSGLRASIMRLRYGNSALWQTYPRRGQQRRRKQPVRELGFYLELREQALSQFALHPDGQGLWTGVSASSSRIKFKDIINKGYGVGIAYTETKSDFSPVLSVKECRAYKGKIGQDLSLRHKYRKRFCLLDLRNKLSAVGRKYHSLLISERNRELLR